MAIMSLAQQGSGFPFFGNSTFLYLCSQDISNIDVAVDEVPDHETRTLIKQVSVYALYVVITINNEY